MLFATDWKVLLQSPTGVLPIHRASSSISPVLRTQEKAKIKTHELASLSTWDGGGRN